MHGGQDDPFLKGKWQTTVGMVLAFDVFVFELGASWYMHIINHQVCKKLVWRHLNLEKSFAGYQSAIGGMCDQPKERIRKPANSCKTKNHRKKHHNETIKLSQTS